ncbi:uncharacterized protein cubi_01519 [Cryptosporidium ubiquitum]|uniref:Uncharacterized protein n=1 Tax=Cryptosporidium ubiquitum TaxID=857276 RepID=A0A1J4MD66_9CRYT|nr:uncharacterized protein cubi_01519 [Cryptosporidium ubiquitum]OII72186.1 hypothetical protein cubi_01519 [Cryptosporidium ubiquitum]
MSLRIRPNYRKLWFALFLTILALTDFTGKVLYGLKWPSGVELSFLKFFGKFRLRSVSSNLNNSKKKSLKKLEVPFISPECSISSNIKRDTELNNETALKANISTSEIFEAKIGFGNNYISLLPLLLGKERFDLVVKTIENELKLYNHLKAFPKRIEIVEKYIQLYTFCSYFSPMLSCEIKKISDNLENLSNGTSILSDVSNNITNPNLLYNRRPNSSVVNFPWVSSKYSYKWNVISGAYGDVICGKIVGGNKNILSHSQDSTSFFFSTYKNFKSKEYVVFLSSSEVSETNLKYKQLETGKDIHICIKSFRSATHPEYFTIWNDENFNLKWLERDTWLSGLENEMYIRFTPNQIFIAPRILKNTNRSSGNILVTQLNEKSSHVCIKNCENSIFYPSVYESHYPWNIPSGRFWSSYLIMERFIGPSFSDVSNFLVLDSVINWTKLSKDNFYLWSASLIHVVYLFFSALISFTFTGSLLYQHCDLHANNLILLIENWKIAENDLFSTAKFQVSFKETISEILSSSIKNVKIIDLTYITYLNDKRRSSNLVCETFGEVSIRDIENWIIFLYNLKNDVDNIFSKHQDIPKNINPLSILIKLFERDINFNSTKPKYVGGSELWWKNWTFNQNKFDDLYDSVLGVGNFFKEAINQVESLIFENENIPFFPPLKSSYSKVLTNPIIFEVYFKQLFYVPYSILSFGTCIHQHEMIHNQTYFLTAAETLSHYFLILFQNEPDKLPSWAHKDQFGSKLLWNKCIKSNPLFSKSISENSLKEFYYEPCFTESCVSKKFFSKKIKTWIQEDSQDRDFFFNSSEKLILFSTNKINFALSILVLNQIKFNVKDYLMNSPKKLIQISVDFSSSISNYLINVIHQEKSVQDIHLFLSFCLAEYYKHLLLFINLSNFNFGEKLCSKIHKAIFIKYTNS